MTSARQELVLDPADASVAVGGPFPVTSQREERDDITRDDPRPASSNSITVIQSCPGWQLINVRELWKFRDLLAFLVWRDVKVRYAQSAIGIGWAIIQPVSSMIVFAVIFGRLAKVPSDGVPYAVFTLTALVPWTYFSNALVDGANSLVTNAHILSKIYFPRMLMPLSAVLAKLVDFGIATSILLGLMAWYAVVPTWGVLLLPLLILLMMLTAAGLSMWLSAMAVQYRDVKHAMNFIVQILMYAAPVVYPASLIPEKYRMVYALNPMVGVIEGFRAAFLGTRDMPWDMLAIGTASALVGALSGALYFQFKERLFADVA